MTLKHLFVWLIAFVNPAVALLRQTACQVDKKQIYINKFRNISRLNWMLILISFWWSFGCAIIAQFCQAAPSIWIHFNQPLHRQLLFWNGLIIQFLNYIKLILATAFRLRYFGTCLAHRKIHSLKHGNYVLFNERTHVYHIFSWLVLGLTKTVSMPQTSRRGNWWKDSAAVNVWVLLQNA